MTAQVADMVLENFRIGEDGFRDLDSVVRRHCETVTYYVHKGRSLGDYQTDDVEDLLKDRNGAETGIESVLLHATGVERLKLNIEFGNELVMNGECEDRARLVLLATDARSVMRDRMKGRTPKRKTILQTVAIVFFVLGYLGFQQIQGWSSDRFDAALVTQTRQSDAATRQQLSSVILSTQGLLSQATSALSRHNLNAEVDFLVQQQIRQLNQQITSDKGSVAAIGEIPTNQNPPGWSTSGWLLLGVACAAAAVAAGIGYLVVPNSNSIFLIGDEKRRQDRLGKIRTNLIWTIGGGIIVSVVAGLLLSLLPH